jgi:prepilin-type N-terminal cleavage/methylation domain-containing protein
MKMHHTQLTAYKGFTLIEILTVVAIISVVATVGFAGFRSFNTKRTVENSAKNFENIVVAARNKAQSSELPTGCSELQAFQVRSSGGGCSDDYCLMAVCSNSSYLISDHSFGNSLAFYNDLAVPDAASIDIQFTVLGGNVTGEGEFKFTNGDYTYQIDVVSGGAVFDQGWQ